MGHLTLSDLIQFLTVGWYCSWVIVGGYRSLALFHWGCRIPFYWGPLLKTMQCTPWWRCDTISSRFAKFGVYRSMSSVFVLSHHQNVFLRSVTEVLKPAWNRCLYFLDLFFKLMVDIGGTVQAQPCTAPKISEGGHSMTSYNMTVPVSPDVPLEFEVEIPQAQTIGAPLDRPENFKTFEIPFNSENKWGTQGTQLEFSRSFCWILTWAFFC